MNAINDVLEQYEKKVKLSIRVIAGDVVLVEGDQESLLFLSDLIKAVSSSEENKIQLSPTGAGSLFFDKKSPCGIYINKL